MINLMIIFDVVNIFSMKNYKFSRKLGVGLNWYPGVNWSTTRCLRNSTCLSHILCIWALCCFVIHICFECTKTRSPRIAMDLYWRPPDVHILGTDPSLLLSHNLGNSIEHREIVKKSWNSTSVRRLLIVRQQH